MSPTETLELEPHASAGSLDDPFDRPLAPPRVPSTRMRHLGRWSGPLLATLANGYLVAGGVALLRIDEFLTRDLPVVTVGWWDHTVLLALLHILLGLVLLIAATYGADDVGANLVLGSLLSAGALIVLIEPDALRGVLGVSGRHGLAYLATSALVLLRASAPR